MYFANISISNAPLPQNKVNSSNLGTMTIRIPYNCKAFWHPWIANIISNVTSREAQKDNTTRLKTPKLGNNIAKTQIHIFSPQLLLFCCIVMALIFNILSHTAFEKNGMILFWINIPAKWRLWCGHFQG